MCEGEEREERIRRNRELAKKLAAEVDRRLAEDVEGQRLWDADQAWLASHRAERGLK